MLPKNFRNTYEESPDQLKDLQKKAPDEREFRQWKASRSTLIKQHELHLKFLSQGNLPVRNYTLPRPYPPSQYSIQDERCRTLQLDNLRVESRDPGSTIFLRTITAPYIYSATIVIAEDELGEVSRLTLCNLEDSVIDPITPEGSILAVKQPCWTRLVGGGYHVRVDHPSDLLLLKSDDAIVPDAWRIVQEIDSSKDDKDWKKEGDMFFLKKKFRKALECYNLGLNYLNTNPSSISLIDLYRKKCGVNIVLLRLDDAAKDLSKAIAVHAKSTPDLSHSPISDATIIDSWLHDNSTDDPLQISAKIPRPLRELAARIKFDLGVSQTTPTYNLPLISSYVGPLTLHVDAANYTCDTTVQSTSSHGRGLFAKRNFKAGELICAEKAFVMPGYFIQDRSSDCFLFNLGDETAAPRPGALLFRELVQKLRWNKSLRQEFFELDDGGYWEESGWKVEDEEEVPVDVFRIERIRRLNCFSVPTRSSDILHQPPNSNPEMRNGFWNHASYVNHSCLPNSVRTFIGDIHFLRATRDIAAGEEITHQYVSPAIDIADRQEQYMGTWNFECDCRLCKVDSSIDEGRRKERLRLFEELKASVLRLGERGTTITGIKKIARGMRELEALYLPAVGEKDVYEGLPRLALVHPSLFLVEAWRGVKNTEKMLEYAQKLLRNFGIITRVDAGKFKIDSNAGLVNVEAVRALRYLAEGFSVRGETALANQCLEVARLWYIVITGSEVGVEEFLKS
ncbi:SET domain-containing protein [Lojkania enalia]|uniref:SET domain-containing protein n=1 Tax=Lojkania enalia TaxID=147567 RepID=A0A9P4KCW8_9PLEO|nr:SET domain-containing protein [Didymosphaeria enalia]